MLHKNKLTTTIDTVFLVNTSIIQILSLPTIESSQKKNKKIKNTCTQPLIKDKYKAIIYLKPTPNYLMTRSTRRLPRVIVGSPRRILTIVLRNILAILQYLLPLPPFLFN